jgi:hypothetical protein
MRLKAVAKNMLTEDIAKLDIDHKALRTLLTTRAANMDK